MLKGYLSGGYSDYLKPHEKRPNKNLKIAKSIKIGGNPVFKPFSPDYLVKHRARWYANTNITKLVVTQAELFAALVVAATSTTVYPIFDALKIKRINIVIPTGSGGLFLTEAKFEWANTVGPSKMTDAVALNTENALISVRPDKLSDDSHWFQQGSSQNAFVLTLPVNSMIEVDFSGVIKGTDDSSPGTPITVLAATVGRFYQMSLEGSAIAAAKFNSVGMAQI